MNQIYPIAKLGQWALIINSDDLVYVGQERGMEVMCVKIDFEHKTIDPIIELEKHLKFNYWVEIGKGEKNESLLRISDGFTKDDILTKIMTPLAESLIDRPNT